MESPELLTSIISIVNVALLAALIAIYSKIYTTSRAVFTLGLLFFATMLMLHNIIAVYAYFAMAPLYSDELFPYFVAIHLAELAGIVALLKVTLD
ncbi:MAG: hypothetical protein ACRD5J_11005 [Nitrososphaeraceae archaeon]